MSTAAQEAKARKLLKQKENGTLKFSTRFFTRCAVSGRRRGYIRYFGLGRNMFREMARKGLLPGVRKSSW